MANNPKSESDSVAARELVLFIENDADLYRQQYTPIIKNLMRKRRKGIFDKEKAVKLFEYLTEAGAKGYLKKYGVAGEPISDVFTKATRRLAAQELTDSFVTEAELGNYDEMDLRIGHNPAPYDPGNTGERSGVERAAYDQGYLGPTGSTGHSMNEPASSPDELGQPEVDSMTGETMKLKSNPKSYFRFMGWYRWIDGAGIAAVFASSDTNTGFEWYEHIGQHGEGIDPRLHSGVKKVSLATALKVDPNTVEDTQRLYGDIKGVAAKNPHERQVPPQGSFTTENLTPGFLAGESYGHEGRPGGLEPLPEAARLNPVPLRAGNEPGEMPKLNPLTLGGGPDDGGSSGVTVEPSGSALPSPKGETFGGSVLKDKDGEMPKLNPVHNRPPRGVKGNPMDLSSFGGRHLGASGHTLDTSGSANVDEGKGRSEMPKLNPTGMRCPHCQKVVSGGIGKPGEYTCSGCGGKLVLVRG